MTSSRIESQPATRRPRLAAHERREEILEAARAVFVRHGLAGARTRDIAAQAGVNEALLYRHFGSKEEMFEAAVVAPLRETLARLIDDVRTSEVEASSAGRHEATATFFAQVIDAVEEVSPLIGPAVLADRERGSKFYSDQLAPALDALTALLDERLDPRVRGHGAPGVRTVAVASMGMCFAVAFDHHLGGQRIESVPDTAAELANLVIDGVGGPVVKKRRASKPAPA